MATQNVRLGSCRGLCSSALLGLVLACSTSNLRSVSSAAPSAEPGAPLASGAETAVAPKRVRPASGRGELARFTDPERAHKIAALAEQQRAELEAELRTLEAPGFAWGLVVDDALVVSGAQGTTRVDHGLPLTTSSVFRIGSMTKVFTAIALLKLRDRGQLSLDAPLRTWLPEFDGVVYPSKDSPLITARHMLLHQSGLPRLGAYDYTIVDKPVAERDILAALEGVELRAAPGASFEYSNFGYGLLGLLVTRVAKQPFDAYISEQILAPLGMSHSVWAAAAVPEASLARPHATRPDGTLAVVPEWPKAASDGAGGIYSSVEDLARFAAFELSAWPASNAPESSVLARSSLRDSQRLQWVDRVRVRTEGERPRAQVAGEGLGWAVYRDCRFEQVSWHNGGTEGHRAALYLLPTRGVGVIILANRDGVDLDGPARNMLARLHDGGVLPQREPTLVLSAIWRQQVDAALALGQGFDKAKFEALFDPRVHEVFTEEKMKPYFEAGYRELGTCRAGAPRPGHDERWQAALLDCERGDPHVVEAILSPERRVLGIWIGSQPAYAERIRKHAGARSAPEPACSD